MFAIDQPPVLTVSGTTAFTEDGAPVVVAPNLTLTDPDGPNLTGARVAISNHVSGQDMLAFTAQSGITGSFSTSTGILTLSGSASASAYQSALRSVTYSSTSQNPNTAARSVQFSLSSSLANPDNGHFYEFVSGSVSWTAARTAAASRTLYGLQGYLATVTSAAENLFIQGKLSGTGWLGASDAQMDAHWHWVTGPEGLETGSDGLAGRYFFLQNAGVGGSPVGGNYSNWAPSEPNDWPSSVPGSEDYGHFYTNGTWNDLPNSASVAGYVVEYGGMPGDPTLQITGSATVNVIAVNDAPPPRRITTLPPTVSPRVLRTAPLSASPLWPPTRTTRPARSRTA